MKQIAGSQETVCFLTLLCMCLVFASASAVAQQTANPVTVTGFVEDSSGASIAGVNITLRDSAGSVRARTTANSAGQFSISGVLPGEYVLEAERKTFETSRAQIFISHGSSPPDLQIVMKVATRRETVD